VSERPAMSLTRTQADLIKAEVDAWRARALAAEARVGELTRALNEIDRFAPADGTHGACLECGKVDVVPHDDGCSLGHYINRALASGSTLAGEVKP
jgi:hypothetical protein